MVARVLLGKHPDGTYGLRVSEPGYDVLTNPLDQERLIFNSEWAALNPILVRGQATVAANATTYATTTVNFGVTLAFAPTFFAMWTYDGVNWSRASTARHATSGAIIASTKIALSYTDRLVFRNLSSLAATVNYVVFKTPAFTS